MRAAAFVPTATNFEITLLLKVTRLCGVYSWYLSINVKVLSLKAKK